MAVDLRTRSPLLAACALAVVVAGCSGGGSSEGGADGSSAPRPSRSQGAPAEPSVAAPTRAEASRTPRSVEVTVTVAPAPTGEVEPSSAPVPAPETASSDDSSAWGWLVLAVVLLLGFGTVALLGRGRSRRRWETWCQSTVPQVQAARLAGDLLPLNGRDITDVARWEEIRAGVTQAESGLRTAASTAPRQDAATAAQQSADALSGLAFALESARLLQAAQPPPSAAQLAEADTATRSRRAELDAALQRLEHLVRPAPGSA